MTALVFLRDKAKITAGQKILINGASGSVGSAAIQIAKYYEAVVTAVCSSKNFELVKTLGADEVIDYAKADFTKQNKTYDIVFDVVGNSGFRNCRNILTAKGVYLMTVPQIGVMLQTMRTLKSTGKKAIFAATGLQQKPENLAFLKELVEKGKLKAVIDRTFKLEQIRQAHRYVEAGHKTGSVVIEMT
jgi:NADPH:quinone reductase-like Zn-dependent oxidoreductase